METFGRELSPFGDRHPGRGLVSRDLAVGRFALCPTYRCRDGGCREALLGEWRQGSSRCVSTPGKGGLSSTATGGLVRAGGGRRVEWSLPREAHSADRGSYRTRALSKPLGEAERDLDE